MNALVALALFEIRYQLRQPATWLYALLLFGQGLWLGTASNDGVTNPYLLLAGLGPMVMLVASVLAGQALTKDLEYKTAAYLYTLPITDQIWFMGKFIGVYLTVVAITLFYPFGLAVVAYTQALPIPVGELADGFVRIVVQNVLFVVSVGYAMTVFTRRMTGAYVAMFGLGLYALLTQSYRDVVANNDLLKLLDPFGIGIVTEAVERAGGAVPDLSDTWFISRLLWLGLTFGLLTRAEARFSFDWFASRPADKPDKPEPGMRPDVPVHIQAQPSFTPASQWQAFVQLTRLLLVELTGQAAFRLTLLALLLAAIGYALFYGQPDYLTESLLPTTARMTAIRQPMGLFIGLFLMVWTGELAFRERTTGFWVIYDTLPPPTYLTPVAKLMTMLVVAALLLFILFGVGLGLQLIVGKTPIDWSLYARDLLPDGLFRYWQLIALALFMSMVTSNRLLTHALSATLLLLFTFAPQLTWFDSPLWRYSFLPGSDRYSDLTRYGQFAAARLAFQGLWWAVTAVLLIMAARNWPRGVIRPLSARLPLWFTGIERAYAAGLVLPVSLLIVYGYVIGRSGYASPSFLQSASPVYADAYKTRTAQVALANGRQIPVHITFHHPYNVDLFLKAIQAGLIYGEQIFGSYPYGQLRLTETPSLQKSARSLPAQLYLPEQYGWIADRDSSNDVDYIYYVMIRDVLKQWLPNGIMLGNAPGRPLLAEGLAEYLSAQALGKRYGSARLTSQLTRYTIAYTKSRSQRTTIELPVIQTSDTSVGRDQAALVLSRIGQVWGDTNLVHLIGQFYRSAVATGNRCRFLRSA